MTKIAPCLWFDESKAEEAAQFYTSLFPNSRIDNVYRSPADTPSGPAGAVLTVDFTLDGQKFIGLNGGPDFRFNEAISFSIDCQDQAEVDRYWEALVQGGPIVEVHRRREHEVGLRAERFPHAPDARGPQPGGLRDQRQVLVAIPRLERGQGVGASVGRAVEDEQRGHAMAPFVSTRSARSARWRAMSSVDR